MTQKLAAFNRSFFKKTLAVGALVTSFGLTSCSNTDPKLEPFKKKEEVKKVESRVNPLGALPKLDILFVIDDSYSMNVHQATLAANIDTFVKQFASGALLDYHIGVTTTTIANSSMDGRLFGTPKFVDPQTPNGLAALRRNLLVGVQGSGDEKLFEPILAALGPRLQDYNKGFYRDDALLAVILITDAEDHGTGSPESVYDFLVNAKKGGKKDLVSVSAVYVPTSDDVCTRDEPGSPYSQAGLPLRIEEFIKLSGASSFSLCDPSYGQKLSAVGKDLFRKVLKVLRLTRAPLVETIVVKFGTQVIPQDSKKGWIYDPATVSLIFGEEITWTSQPPGTQLSVDFDPIDFDKINPKSY